MMRRFAGLLLAFLLCASPVAAQVTVAFGTHYQTIDGFGGAEVFEDSISDANMDFFFGTGSGQLGLTIMRVGIAPDGGTMGTWSNITKAVARGARIVAAPWSAPASWKDNNDENNGGNLLTARYSDWADRLAAFQATMIANTSGVTSLYMLSPQNEPDYTAGYISMRFDATTMNNFVKVLGPKVAALSPRPLVGVPDTSSWGSQWAFADAILADGASLPYLDLAIGHQYSGMYAPTGNWTGRIWQTEMSDFGGFDAGIGNGIGSAVWVHDAMVTGNVSAWLYWWLIGINADNEGLIGFSHGTQITKRAYTLGQYSRFVRPSAVRVAATGEPSNTDITAFQNASNGTAVIVVINYNGDQTLTFNTSGLTLSSVTPYVTSSTQDMAALTPITVTGGSFSATVANYTVTTFVGTPDVTVTRYRTRTLRRVQ